MNTKNYYRLLNVSPDATPGEVKKAYLSCVKNMHPDGCPKDSPEWILRNNLMIKFNEAYSILRELAVYKQRDREREKEREMAVSRG